MKTYTIQYLCENCGCLTKKSYSKGVKAENCTTCDNCGCNAIKKFNADKKHPKSPEKNIWDDIPYEPTKPINPFDEYPPIKPWIPYKKPYEPYRKFPEHWLDDSYHDRHTLLLSAFQTF